MSKYNASQLYLVHQNKEISKWRFERKLLHTPFDSEILSLTSTKILLWCLLPTVFPGILERSVKSLKRIKARQEGNCNIPARSNLAVCLSYISSLVPLCCKSHLLLYYAKCCHRFLYGRLLFSCTILFPHQCIPKAFFQAYLTIVIYICLCVFCLGFCR